MYQPNSMTKGIGFNSSISNQHSGVSYFLGIGINRHREYGNLVNAVKDIEDCSKLLIEKYGFKREHTFLLQNELATRSNIIKHLEMLQDLVTPRDKVLILFSGHGERKDIREHSWGYWVTYDGEQGSKANHIKNSEVIDFIKMINSKHTLLISDSCYSGTFFDKSTVRNGTLFAQLESQASRWIICSSPADKIASDGYPGRNSPFMEALLRVLRNNKAWKISASQLLIEIKKRIVEPSKQFPLGWPLQITEHKGGEFVFTNQKSYQNSSAYLASGNPCDQRINKTYGHHIQMDNKKPTSVQPIPEVSKGSLLTRISNGLSESISKKLEKPMALYLEIFTTEKFRSPYTYQGKHRFSIFKLTILSAIIWGLALGYWPDISTRIFSNFKSISDYTVYYAYGIPAIIGGFLVGILIRRTYDEIIMIDVILLSCAWGLAFILVGKVFVGTTINDIEQFKGLMVGSALAFCTAITMGPVLKMEYGSSLDWGEAILFAIIYGLSWVIAWLVSTRFLGFPSPANDFNPLNSWMLSSVFSGLIGGAVFFWRSRSLYR